MDNDVKWLAIMIIGVVFAIAASAFAPNGIAQKIEACMTQPDMQYISGNCVPIVRKINE
jgi:hypothetical protein